jgi:hypothetical protein
VTQRFEATLKITRPCLLLLIVSLAGVPVRAQTTPSIRFVDATADSGIEFRNVCGAQPGSKGWLTESMGAGAAWLDYDADGNLDLYLVNGSTHERKPGAGEPNQLLRGDGKGHFTDVTSQAGVGDRGWGYGVAVGDIDNDGNADIYVTNQGTNALFRNRGDGKFEELTGKAGVGGAAVWSTAAAFFDIDADGDLDLYVGNYMESDTTRIPRRGTQEAIDYLCTYNGIPVVCGPLRQVPKQDVLYRNNGDGTFSDVTSASGLLLETPRFTLGVVTADFDNDGDPDIYVANDSVQNSLWQNRGDGTFVDVGVGALVGLNADGKPQAGMGTDFGDYNADGWLDIVVTNFAQDLNTVYRNMGGKFFIDDSLLAGMEVTRLALSWGAGFVDFDRDRDLDLFIANGHVYPQVESYDLGTSFRQTNHLFVNDNGRFTERGADSGPALGVARSFRGAAFGDYDNDGDVDALVTALDEGVLLMRNETTAPGHFLQVRLVGTTSNRDAVGARVTVVAAGRPYMRERKGGGSYLSASDPRLHFGLGAEETVQMLQVRWPSGKKEIMRNVPADQLVTMVEGEVQQAEP